jgi:hypothetical protein
MTSPTTQAVLNCFLEAPQREDWVLPFELPPPREDDEYTGVWKQHCFLDADGDEYAFDVYNHREAPEELTTAQWLERSVNAVEVLGKLKSYDDYRFAIERLREMKKKVEAEGGLWKPFCERSFERLCYKTICRWMTTTIDFAKLEAHYDAAVLHTSFTMTRINKLWKAV